MENLINGYRTLTYVKQKLSASACINKYLSEYEINASEDRIKNELKVRVNAIFFSMMEKEKEETLTFNRPSFMDWILRRKKTVSFTVSCHKILENPPKTNEPLIYRVECIRKSHGV